jgi:alanyl-tRNA synthetase
VQGPTSVELWNLVFTQFNRQPDGTLKPLPKPNIDTGMGLERLASVLLQQETGRTDITDYETDLFAPIINGIREWPRRSETTAERLVFAERAIADHLRAIVFLIADGVRPSNESRGYVLRLLIRRAFGLGRIIRGMDVTTWHRYPSGGPANVFLALLTDDVRISMEGSPYHPELVEQRGLITQVVDQEEAQFIGTLESGTSRLDALLEELKASKTKIIPGEEVFTLYDTYGFPLELTVDIAQERGLSVDRAGFEAALREQQERSRAASQFGGGVFVTDALEIRAAIPEAPPRDVQFVGYDRLTADARILGLWDGRSWVSQVHAGQSVGVILDRSPFYGEAGGQIGDTGRIEGPRGLAEVAQTTWVDDVLVHQATVRHGSLSVQEPVRATVDAGRRLKIARSHTATHLLHWALRRVLGPQTVQAGSFVEPERIRFDFSSAGGLREEQRQEVEALVTSRIRQADAVRTDVMALEAARRAGALAFFGEKYGQRVRVVTIGDYSTELCGGTHLAHTGSVGTLTLISESSIAAGTRRIEALVGEAATQHHQQQVRILQEAARRLGRPAQELVAGLEDLLERIKRLEQERKDLQQEVARVEAERLVAQGRQIDGVTLVTSTIRQADRELLAMLADAVRRSLRQEGIVLLAATETPSRVALVMATTAGLANRIHAGQVLKAIAPLTQGSGGGRAEFAQGGGKDPSGIPAALKRAEELVREALARSV